MNGTTTCEHTSRGVFLPVFLVALSVIVTFYWQIKIVRMQRQMTVNQITQRAQVVNESRAVQANLEKLLRELLAVSSRDGDARALVEKYQIRVDMPPQAATPAPSASAP